MLVQCYIAETLHWFADKETREFSALWRAYDICGGLWVQMLNIVYEDIMILEGVLYCIVLYCIVL